MAARTRRESRRVKPIRFVPPPPGADLAEIARASRYEGRAYHRTIRTDAGHPIYRPGKSKCPEELQGDPVRVTQWLRAAILAGRFGAFEGGFPSRVWHREGDIVFEARQGTPGSGVYHGFPLSGARRIKGL